MRNVLCGVPCTVLLLVLYRDGGVDWLRTLGATWLPGVFGWFVWKDEGIKPLARWVALLSAVLQAMSFVAVLGLSLFGPMYLKRLAVQAQLQPPDVEEAPTKPSAPATEDELAALGLRPPCTVTSKPPGARVFVNGQERGVTPLETRLVAGQRNTVRLELAGFFTDSRIVEPNANERTAFELELRVGGRLKVITEPPGAKVFVGGEPVLEKSPGVTATLEPGEVELLLLLDGHEPRLERARVEGGALDELALTLTPGTLFPIESTPSHATVRLDGVVVGVTPLQLFIGPGAKRKLEVSREGWSTVTRVLPKVVPGQQWAVTLTHLKVAPLKKAFLAAQRAYDKANAELEKLQVKTERISTPALDRQLAKAEAAMEKAASRLEHADAQLKEAEEEAAADLK